jgi:hypothetical protein
MYLYNHSVDTSVLVQVQLYINVNILTVHIRSGVRSWLTVQYMYVQMCKFNQL